MGPITFHFFCTIWTFQKTSHTFSLKYVEHAYASVIAQTKSPFRQDQVQELPPTITFHGVPWCAVLFHTSVTLLCPHLCLVLYLPIICLETPPGPSRPTWALPPLGSLSRFHRITYSLLICCISLYLSSYKFLLNFTFVSVSFIGLGGHRYQLSLCKLS